MRVEKLTGGKPTTYTIITENREDSKVLCGLLGEMFTAKSVEEAWEIFNMTAQSYEKQD